MLLVGILYFLAFIPANLQGAKSETMLSRTSIDEPVTYPYVVRMLTPASDWRDLFSRWVLYGDYHYGYPFYFLSALSVLPVRLIYGARFTDHTALNLLLLRQLISVLPMILAVAVLAYSSVGRGRLLVLGGLFVFVLSTRAVVRQNIQWWHPDALSVLAVALVLHFLQRDNLRFGRYFYLSAVLCGLAAGIKLAGVWFFLTVAVYLLLGFKRRVLTLGRTVVMGALFLAVMGLALVVSNPFLYNSGARQEMIAIQTYKTTELDQGYSHDDPLYYSKGLRWWLPTLQNWYAHPFVLLFLFLSLLAGCVWGSRRLYNLLVLTWIIPYSVYLLYFVAVKPDHYWLPVMLPLFAAAANIVVLVTEGDNALVKRLGRYRSLVWVLVVAVMAGQMVWNVAHPGTGLYALYSRSMRVETELPTQSFDVRSRMAAANLEK